MNAPNILLVVLDTARADAFEPYGAGRGATPTVAQLAAGGTVHPYAVAPCNWTMPSHVGMLTGALPRSVGLGKAPGGSPAGCKPSLEAIADRYLPEVLRRNGYTTAGVSTNPWVSTASGFATGFDEFHDAKGERAHDIGVGGLRSRLNWGLEGLLGRVDDGADAAGVLLHRWLREGPGRPFFWFVNLIECHSPYLPPRPYNDLALRWRVGAAEEARRHLTLEAIWRVCASEVPPPDDVLARMRHLYARSIRQMDDWLSRLLEEMHARGVLDDTLVIVTSDHGENLGEGRLLGHAVSLDDRLVHVPLVVSGPGAFGADGPTSLSSLPRWIAEAIELNEHPYDPDDLPSAAVVTGYDPPVGADDPRTRHLSEWGATEEGFHRFTQPGTAATDGRHKLVRVGDVEGVYDLVEDRLEVAPLPVENARSRWPDAVDDLRRALEQADARTRPPVAPADGPAEGSEEETAELEARMRLLGYM